MTPRTHDRVTEQASRTPQAPAVAWRDTEMSYGELERRSNRLAHWLRERGAGPERVVAVALARTPHLPVALLAVLKTGAAYLPMDPTLPRSRRDYMVRNSAALLTVTEQLLHAADDEIAAHPDDRPPAPAGSPGNLAYVMYTSGSTGSPKGVMVQHDQLAAYLDWAVPAYLADGDGAALHTPVSFDMSVTSLLAPLTAGLQVVLLPVEDPPVTALPAELAAGRLSFAKLTPAHLTLLADVMKPAGMAAVRRLVVGGEALSYQHLTLWRDHAPDTRVWNEYGPTEAVVGCCTHSFPASQAGSGPVPIGRAVPGTRLVLLDERLQPVRAGEPGELCVGGAQVTRGYLGRPGLTARCWVPDPDGGGARLYRTGDLARELPDGTLMYVGRRDSQIKLRGYRIELGEIETVLAQHPDVAAAAVAVHGEGAGRRLTGYLVPRVPDGFSPEPVRAHAADALPAYMVPAAFETLDALPLTSGGKVDRRALPEPHPAAEPTARPEGHAEPYEAEVAAVFGEVLGRTVTAYDADFVALGGTSLQISQVIGRIARAYDLDLPADAWLRVPTVAGFARLVDTCLRDGIEAARAADDLDFDLGLDDDILAGLTKEDLSASN